MNYALTPFIRKGRNNLITTHRMYSPFMRDDFFSSFFNNREMYTNMKVDVIDNGDKYVLEADLPGLTKEQVEITIDDGVLTLATKQDNAQEEKKDDYIYRERVYGKMCRSFSLENIDEDAVKAEFKNGVLNVELPKKDVSDKKRRLIDIA